MNVLFHLIPKEKVAFIYDNFTLRQAMEKMEYHRYTAVPILSESGKYIGILREGDILWHIKNINRFDLQYAESILVKDLNRKKDHANVNIDADIDELIKLSVDQNFIPVVDDRKNFIGIVTRKAIITHLAQKYKENNNGI
ncbi:CBS domain-containing protein [Haploplasma modicum]|jgi:CBS domain-containing protein|uniref:CBS domain-containing protein n=1 Tax=Haploplasma modicum TaxID=2150 RepID=UPI000478D255|nr:CBS domain-containing protein [Haploplasma modicum]MCR1808631.1 CBS domain-containing protein [Haploplasma modicum]